MGGPQFGGMGAAWLHAPLAPHTRQSLRIDASKGLAFGSIGKRCDQHRLALLGWTVLIASMLVFASLLQSAATSALGAPEGSVLATAPVYDIVTIGWPGGTLYRPVPASQNIYTTASCAVPATDGTACISATPLSQAEQAQLELSCCSYQ
jgi:hypothetical protein